MGIYVVGADGSDLTKLAEGTQPAWSPDGTKIAFLRDLDLFVMSEEGSLVAQVTSGRVASLGPAWQPIPVDDEAPTPGATTTPAGTITVPEDAIPEGTFLVQTDAGAEVLQAGSEMSSSVPGIRVPLDLSPDGSTVLGSTGTALVAVDLRTGEIRALVGPAGEDVLGAFAEWSPDGSMVAYSLGAGDPADRSTLCVLDLSSEQPRCFPEVERVYTFDWSPDGSSLVVAGPPVQPVRIVDVATGGVSDVVAQEGDTPINDAIREAGMGESFQLVGPRWSPSGTYLAALANLRDSEFSYVPVVFTPDGRFVAFGRASGEFPEPFEWSPVADVLAYTRGEAPYRITEAYLLDPASGEDAVLVSDHGAGSFVLTDMAWAPSGHWLAVAGWEDRGEGRFQTSFRVLDAADPSSFQQFSVDTGEVYSFIAGWGP
jgi:Tol biopolymer transport system component